MLFRFHISTRPQQLAICLMLSLMKWYHGVCIFIGENATG